MAALSILAGGPVEISHLNQHASHERHLLDWNCNDVTWTPNSGLTGSNFYGEMMSDCTVKATKGTGFPTLEQFVIKKVTTESTVNEGPTAETYLNMPGVKYDVSLTFKTSNGDINLKEDVHVATDKQNKLAFHSFSTDVSGTGYAEYLKRLDVVIDVTKVDMNGNYGIKIDSVTQIDKPWFAPDEMFLEKVKPAMEQKFREIRDQVVPQMADNL